MFERFSAPARAAVEAAQGFSEGQAYLGTQHLLKGLAADGRSEAGRLLVNRDRPLTTQVSASCSVPFSPAAKASLGIALQSAIEHGRSSVTSIDLLFGVLSVVAGVADQADDIDLLSTVRGVVSDIEE
jgi:hypothetical protein